MPRFYAPKENVNGNIIKIDGQEARHILNVMRLKEEDKVVVFDGTGSEYVGFIKEAKPKSLVVEVVTTRKPKLNVLPKITLAQSVPKKEKMDYIVEKATELGVSSIIPITSERTVVKLDEKKKANKEARWKKIAVEAAKQCGRADVPEIKSTQKFYNAIDSVNDFDLALMATIADETIDFKDAILDFEAGKIIVFIGPEGDFTPEEIEMARDTNCKFVSFGKMVLKSDTAALYALSILNHELSR